ncbi:nucleotidyltransferase family protein [Halomicronema sp. CCY15110]|uniref:nucleotidyltransferase family protein n=1 Tax=Halomicronema sp. CCY15110 TaxID=2767773 RepID=UPI00194E1A96|nr:nucleotidyltransferase family protein [Halomicronema sp. CCY15110]
MSELSNSKIQDLLRARKTEILAIAARHGAYNIRVFGSVARDEDTATSDIDLLVDYDSTKRSPWFPVGFVQELEALLNHKVDVATPAMLKERIRDRVLQEATPL